MSRAIPYESRPLEMPVAARAKINFANPLVYILLCSYLVLVLFPMFWLFYSSLKSDREIFLYPFRLPSIAHLQFSNFSTAWVQAHFRDFFLNTIVLTFSTVAV